MEQGRLFLALGLSLLLMFTYQELVLKRAPGGDQPIATAEVPRTSGGGSAPQPASAPARGSRQRGFTAPTSGGQPVIVSTDKFRAVFSRRGGRLLDLELRGFRRDLDEASPSLDLVFPSPVLPLTVALGQNLGDAAVPYTPSTTELNLTGGQAGEVVFSWRSTNGRKLTKRYAFKGDSLSFSVSAEGEFKGQKPTAFVLTPLRPDQATPDPSKDNAIVLAKGKYAETHTKGLLTASTEHSDAKWAGFATQYFLMTAVLDEPLGAVTFGLVENWPAAIISPRRGAPLSASIFAGPKERSVLQAAGNDLDRALDFGWFWFMALPLLEMLRLLFSVTGNYGVAIILLTAGVRAVTIPLSQSTFRNMREMQKIQPQIERLRQRFKDDQAGLQKEMMELYRRHGVNPFSGCLPMVLQLPVFVGLYNALYHAIELRHAPFALWINDLSAPDRLMIGGIGVPVLTLLMGGSMLLQQMLTPQQGDPTQRTMMMVMPLVFTFMFVNFPSGLVLYWLVSNLLSIAQQYFVMKART